MAENHIIDWLGTTLLMLFGTPMIVQGHFIFHGKYGYRHTEREKQKLKNVREQVEKVFKKEE